MRRVEIWPNSVNVKLKDGGKSHLASILDESSTARMRIAFTEKSDMLGAIVATCGD